MAMTGYRTSRQPICASVRASFGLKRSADLDRQGRPLFVCLLLCRDLLGALLRYDADPAREPGWPERDRFLMGKGTRPSASSRSCRSRFLRPFMARRLHPPRQPAWRSPRHAQGARRRFQLRFDRPCAFQRRRHGAGCRFQHQDFNVFVLLGDGEMQEARCGRPPSAAPPIASARLVAIVDRNGYQLDGKVDDVAAVEPLDEKWRAFGWEVHEVDGHDVVALANLLRAIKADTKREKPCCVIARTMKGKGIDYMETEPGWHLAISRPKTKRAPAT